MTKIGSDANPPVDVTGRQLQNANFFRVAVAALGDLDKDGVPDLAVGARGGNDTKGSIWILFLNSDGSVK